MITKIDSLTDISKEFGTTLSAAGKMSWFYDNKNPASPVQPVMGGGKITDWIGYEHKNPTTVKLQSYYDSNGIRLSTPTGVIGAALATSDNEIIANTGDGNISIEKEIFKYKIIPYANTLVRVYADQTFSGTIIANASGLYKFVVDNNVITTNFIPKTISIRDINSKLLRTEFEIYTNGNADKPNGYIFTNRAEICTNDNIAKYFTFQVRFYYKSGCSSFTIKNISDTGYTETLNTYINTSAGYRYGSTWRFMQNTILEII